MKELLGIISFLVILTLFTKGCEITINDQKYYLKFSEIAK